MRLSRRWRIMQFEEDVIHRARGWRPAVDNILRDLHNSSHRTTVVINSKYLSVLNMLTSSQSFFKTLAYFSARFKDINRRFFLQIILKKKIKSIEQYVCAFLNFFHSVQNRSSAISSSNSCKGHFLVHFCPSSLVSNQIYHRSASFPIKYIIESMVYCSHLPNMVSARWLWRINILNEYRLFNRELKLGWRRRDWNVAKKMNSRPFKFYRVYLDAFNLSNEGDYSWSLILKDFIQVQKERGKFVVVCSRPP